MMNFVCANLRFFFTLSLFGAKKICVCRFCFVVALDTDVNSFAHACKDFAAFDAQNAVMLTNISCAAVESFASRFAVHGF
jgi:hypothetical protein